MSRLFNGIKWRAFVGTAVLLAGGLDVRADDYLPTLEEVYGGRVIGISAVALDANVTRLFVSTESANSAFYGDVDHALPQPFSADNFRFEMIPDLDAAANFGNLNAIIGHAGSGRLFFAHDRGLFGCGIAPDTLVALHTNAPLGGLLLQADVLLGWGGPGTIRWGTLDADGTLQDWSAPLATGLGPAILLMAVHPGNGRLYVMDRDDGRIIKKSSHDFDALSAATTFSDIAVTDAADDWTGKSFAIAPDGRLFVGGDDGGWKKLVYSDDDGANWTLVETGIGGGVGTLTFVGDAADYLVIAGSAVSTNKGTAGSWTSLPRPGGTRTTNPNDGPAAADPNNADVFYFTTDLGIGTTVNAGADIFDIEQGLVAVQINDFDMTDAKEIAWSASKSGVHRAVGFPDNPEWSRAMFPNGDGAPYYAVAVDRADVSGMTAYAGNNNIYKTTDGGEHWVQCYQIQEWLPYYVACLAVQGDMVMAGTYMHRQMRPDLLGWLMISTNGGANFVNYVIDDEPGGLNVNDILLTNEDGQGVAYVAAEMDLQGVAANGAGHVYRLVMGGEDSKIELADEPVSIRNLAMDSLGGIYASGMYSNHAPAVFYKAPDTDVWTALTTDGLPADVRPAANPNWRGPVLAVGVDSENNDVPVLAADVRLFYLPAGGAKWLTNPSMAYPNGTQINVLYWDELMVGTDAGLFAHPTNLDPVDEFDLLPVAGDFNGDGATDLVALDEQGRAYVWWAAQGYSRVNGPVNLGVAGLPAAGDIDGDGQSDLVVVDSQGRAHVWYSGEGYAVAHGPVTLGVQGRPVLGDFDGDGRADLVMVDEQGRAHVWYSGEGYAVAHGPVALGVQGQPAAGDMDGDGLAELIITDGQGNVTVWLSTEGYAQPFHLCPLDWDMTGMVVAGDFDGDGLADLLDLHDEGQVFMRASRSAWAQRDGPYTLPMPPVD